ncbi:MAG: sensor histidine kinase [Haloferacaceae archaeon]
MNRRWLGYVAVVLGVAIVGNALWHVATHDIDHSVTHLLANVVFLGGSGAVVLYGGYLHATRPLDAGRYPRLVGWTVASVLLVSGLGAVIVHVGSEQVRPIELYEALQLSGSVGLAVGLSIGTVEARSIVSAKAAARAEARTEALEAEKRRIEHLNDLLRHYVLNGANIIGGYTESLKSSVPPEDEATLDTIADRADTMATLVEHVRTLTVVDQGDFTATSVRLSRVLDSIVADRRGSALTVTVPDCGRSVRANELLGEALFLLFDALATLTEADGTVAADCSHSARSVTLTVTATPAELPPAVEQSLFDPVGPGVGLEFYLAHTLLDPYADVSLVRNADETVRFELVFDRAADDTGK